eukprot:Clim_evm44s134 gene=Clim_evmTU44s134
MATLDQVEVLPSPLEAKGSDLEAKVSASVVYVLLPEGEFTEEDQMAWFVRNLGNTMVPFSGDAGIAKAQRDSHFVLGVVTETIPFNGQGSGVWSTGSAQNPSLEASTVTEPGLDKSDSVRSQETGIPGQAAEQIYQQELTLETSVIFISRRYHVTVSLDMSPTQLFLNYTGRLPRIGLEEQKEALRVLLYHMVRPIAIPGGFTSYQPEIVLSVILQITGVGDIAHDVRCLCSPIVITEENIDHVFDVMCLRLRGIEQEVADLGKVTITSAKSKTYEERFETETHKYLESLSATVESMRGSADPVALFMVDSCRALGDGRIQFGNAQAEFHRLGVRTSVITSNLAHEIGTSAFGLVPEMDSHRLLAGRLGGYLFLLETINDDQNTAMLDPFPTALYCKPLTRECRRALIMKYQHVDWFSESNLFMRDFDRMTRKPRKSYVLPCSIRTLIASRAVEGFFLIQFQPYVSPETAPLDSENESSPTVMEAVLQLPLNTGLRIEYRIRSKTSHGPYAIGEAWINVSTLEAKDAEDRSPEVKVMLDMIISCDKLLKHFSEFTNFRSGSKTMVLRSENGLFYSTSQGQNIHTQPVPEVAKSFQRLKNLIKPSFAGLKGQDSEFISYWKVLVQMPYHMWYHVLDIKRIMVLYASKATETDTVWTSKVSTDTSQNALYSMLRDWCNIVLIRNQIYIRYIKDESIGVTGFCVLGLSKVTPLMTEMMIGMFNASGALFNETLREIRHRVRQLGNTTGAWGSNVYLPLITEMSSNLLRFGIARKAAADEAARDIKSMIVPSIDGTQYEPPLLSNLQQRRVVQLDFTSMSEVITKCKSRVPSRNMDYYVRIVLGNRLSEAYAPVAKTDTYVTLAKVLQFSKETAIGFLTAEESDTPAICQVTICRPTEDDINSLTVGIWIEPQSGLCDDRNVRGLKWHQIPEVILEEDVRLLRLIVTFDALNIVAAHGFPDSLIFDDKFKVPAYEGVLHVKPSVATLVQGANVQLHRFTELNFSHERSWITKTSPSLINLNEAESQQKAHADAALAQLELVWMTRQVFLRHVIDAGYVHLRCRQAHAQDALLTILKRLERRTSEPVDMDKLLDDAISSDNVIIDILVKARPDGTIIMVVIPNSSQPCSTLADQRKLPFTVGFTEMTPPIIEAMLETGAKESTSLKVSGGGLLSPSPSEDRDINLELSDDGEAQNTADHLKHLHVRSLIDTAYVCMQMGIQFAKEDVERITRHGNEIDFEIDITSFVRRMLTTPASEGTGVVETANASVHASMFAKHFQTVVERNFVPTTAGLFYFTNPPCLSAIFEDVISAKQVRHVADPALVSANKDTGDSSALQTGFHELKPLFLRFECVFRQGNRDGKSFFYTRHVTSLLEGIKDCLSLPEFKDFDLNDPSVDVTLCLVFIVPEDISEDVQLEKLNGRQSHRPTRSGSGGSISERSGESLDSYMLSETDHKHSDVDSEGPEIPNDNDDNDQVLPLDQKLLAIQLHADLRWLVDHQQIDKMMVEGTLSGNDLHFAARHFRTHSPISNLVSSDIIKLELLALERSESSIMKGLKRDPPLGKDWIVQGKIAVLSGSHEVPIVFPRKQSKASDRLAVAGHGELAGSEISGYRSVDTSMQDVGSQFTGPTGSSEAVTELGCEQVQLPGEDVSGNHQPTTMQRYMLVVEFESDRAWLHQYNQPVHGIEVQSVLLTGIVADKIRAIVKHINQGTLLRELHETHHMSPMLMPAGNPLSTASPDRPRKLMNPANSPAQPLRSGEFQCDTLFSVHLPLHQRLPAAQAIGVVNNTLANMSVTNVRNHFVYQDEKTGHIFILRVSESLVRTGEAHDSNLEDQGGSTDLDRSSITRTVPNTPDVLLDESRSDLQMLQGEDDHISMNLSDVFGEDPGTRESLLLEVLGIDEAPEELTVEMVQLLQRRLDQAVITVLSTMLIRNKNLKLYQHDVDFIKQGKEAADNVLSYSIPPEVTHEPRFMRILHERLSRVTSVMPEIVNRNEATTPDVPLLASDNVNTDDWETPNIKYPGRVLRILKQLNGIEGRTGTLLPLERLSTNCMSYVHCSQLPLPYGKTGMKETGGPNGLSHIRVQLFATESEEFLDIGDLTAQNDDEPHNIVVHIWSVGWANMENVVAGLNSLVLATVCIYAQELCLDKLSPVIEIALPPSQNGPGPRHRNRTFRVLNPSYLGSISAIHDAGTALEAPEFRRCTLPSFVPTASRRYFWTHARDRWSSKLSDFHQVSFSAMPIGDPHFILPVLQGDPVGSLSSGQDLNGFHYWIGIKWDSANPATGKSGDDKPIRRTSTFKVDHHRVGMVVIIFTNDNISVMSYDRGGSTHDGVVTVLARHVCWYAIRMRCLNTLTMQKAYHYHAGSEIISAYDLVQQVPSGCRQDCVSSVRLTPATMQMLKVKIDPLSKEETSNYVMRLGRGRGVLHLVQFGELQPPPALSVLEEMNFRGHMYTTLWKSKPPLWNPLLDDPITQHLIETTCAMHKLGSEQSSRSESFLKALDSDKKVQAHLLPMAIALARVHHFCRAPLIILPQPPDNTQLSVYTEENLELLDDIINTYLSYLESVGMDFAGQIDMDHPDTATPSIARAGSKHTHHLMVDSKSIEPDGMLLDPVVGGETGRSDGFVVVRSYMQRGSTGGIILVEVGYQDNFLLVNIYALEIMRLKLDGQRDRLPVQSGKVRKGMSRNVRLGKLFDQEIAKTKEMLHVRSFSYDFQIHFFQALIQELVQPGSGVRLDEGMDYLLMHYPQPTIYCNNLLYKWSATYTFGGGRPSDGESLTDYVIRRAADFEFVRLNHLPLKSKGNGEVLDFICYTDDYQDGTIESGSERDVRKSGSSHSVGSGGTPRTSKGLEIAQAAISMCAYRYQVLVMFQGDEHNTEEDTVRNKLHFTAYLLANDLLNHFPMHLTGGPDGHPLSQQRREYRDSCFEHLRQVTREKVTDLLYNIQRCHSVDAFWYHARSELPNAELNRATFAEICQEMEIVDAAQLDPRLQRLATMPIHWRGCFNFLRSRFPDLCRSMSASDSADGVTRNGEMLVLITPHTESAAIVLETDPRWDLYDVEASLLRRAALVDVQPLLTVRILFRQDLKQKISDKLGRSPAMARASKGNIYIDEVVNAILSFSSISTGCLWTDWLQDLWIPPSGSASSDFASGTPLRQMLSPDASSPPASPRTLNLSGVLPMTPPIAVGTPRDMSSSSLGSPNPVSPRTRHLSNNSSSLRNVTSRGSMGDGGSGGGESGRWRQQFPSESTEDTGP